MGCTNCQNVIFCCARSRSKAASALTNVIRLWKMHIAMYYDPSVGACVSNRLIRMQIGAVWKMTMQALREAARFVHTNGTSHSLSLPLRQFLHGFAGSSTREKKNLSWICLFHANADTEIKQKGGTARGRGWEESKVFIGQKTGPTCS